MNAIPAPAALPWTERISARLHLVALGGILGLAAWLNLAALSQNGYANEYYSAAVRSMLRSWHNFFFASFDPGGLVSVDKPPLALWLQAASAEVFGYSGLSMLLPEALAGVAAVALLYLLVARYFGRVPGLVAALALAVSPVSVAVNRDNNPDALLAFLLVAAAYLGARAAESGRLRWLIPTAVVVGLAFNTKMLAGLITLPVLALAYLLFAPRPWTTRAWHLVAAGLVLVVVSGAWIAAVELTPAGSRPYVGSTSDNSALSLAVDYNGLGRVTGQDGGTSSGGNGGGLGGAFSGTPGWARLFNDALGDQGAWLIPLAALGGVSALVGAVLVRRRREYAPLLIAGGWFATAAFVLSYSSGIIHTYYVSMLAPATAALVGIGALALWRDARRGGAWLLFPIAAILATAWLQLDLLRRSDYLPWLQNLLIVGAIPAAGALVFVALNNGWPARARSLVAAGALAAAFAALVAAPLAWSASTHRTAVNGVFPGAGPTYLTAGGFGPPGAGAMGPPGGGGGGSMPPAGAPGGFGGAVDTDAALAYAKANGGSARFTLIVASEQAAAPYVVDGQPVAAMGGFTGRETVLTPSYLASLIRAGDARYFLLGGEQGPGGTNSAVELVASKCKAVAAVDGLYDCAGAAEAVAAG